MRLWIDRNAGIVSRCAAEERPLSSPSSITIALSVGHRPHVLSSLSSVCACAWVSVVWTGQDPIVVRAQVFVYVRHGLVVSCLTVACGQCLRLSQSTSVLSDQDPFEVRALSSRS